MDEINRDRSWDVFISHASEDKEELATPLANSLNRKGLNVWYDDAIMKIGASQKKEIDNGLQYSKFGVIIISKNYIRKDWTIYEYRKLYDRQIRENRAIILPIWHNVSESVLKKSPLAFIIDVHALISSIGVNELSKNIFNIIINSKFV